MQKPETIRKPQKIRKTPSGDWIYLSISIHPDELASWKEVAKSADRSLSWWLRKVANLAVAAEKKEREVPNGNSNNLGETDEAPENPSLENIPSHRSRLGVES